MSKPKAKKRPVAGKDAATPSATSATDAPELTTPETDASASVGPAGNHLLIDIQQQCESLRNWHETAAAQLVTREAELDQTAKTLDTKQKHQTEEAQRLIDAQRQLEIGRQQVKQLRAELDEEWSSLRTLRKAQEKLGHELDAERTRLNRNAFKLPAADRQAA